MSPTPTPSPVPTPVPSPVPTPIPAPVPAPIPVPSPVPAPIPSPAPTPTPEIPLPEPEMGTAYAPIVLKGGRKGIRLNGTERADKMLATPFNDVVNGRGGNDRIFPGARKDGYGNDRVFGGKGNDVIGGGKNKDWLDGQDGNDRIFGGKNRDQLVGGAGNDRLVGGTGGDILVGGAGNDTLVGGKGGDMFVFNSVDEGIDTIIDFRAEDRIDLRGIFKTGMDGATPYARFKQFVQLEQVGANTELRIAANDTSTADVVEFKTLATLRNTLVSAVATNNIVIV